MSQSNRLMIKAIYLSENAEDADQRGSAFIDDMYCLQEAAQDITYIIMKSGCFAAIKQPIAEVETALESAIEGNAASVDFVDKSMRGAEVKELTSAAEKQKQQEEDYNHRINQRWVRRDEFNQRKNKKKLSDGLSEADIRGIKLLKESHKARAAEKKAEKRAARTAVVERVMFALGRSVGKMFNLKSPSQKKDSVAILPVTEQPVAVTTVTKVETPAASPKA